MGKLIVWLFVIILFAIGGGYYYYTQTGYTFDLDDTFIFKNVIGVSSPDFKTGSMIPATFTCDGQEISPTFNIKRIPSGTLSLAMIMEDMDAKPESVTYWLVYNLRPDITAFSNTSLFGSSSSGTNDFGSTNYKGPCPEVGKKNRYRFKTYALNIKILNEKIGKQSFERIIDTHVLSTGIITGVYSKTP